MSKGNKTKVINKNGKCQFVIYSRKGQQLNEREIFTISGNSLNGLIPIEVVRKGTSFELIYDLAGMVTFRDYLINPLNKESFSKLLQNILEIFKEMQSAFFNQGCLIMDFDKVMMNPATQRLNFIYIPIQGYNTGANLRNFLLEIIEVGGFAASEDTGYVKEYIKILNNGLNFSIFELEEYIKGLAAENAYQAPKVVECFKCGSKLATGTNFCSVCGAKITGTTGEIGKRAVYDPFSVSNEPVRKETTQKVDAGLRIERVEPQPRIETERKQVVEEARKPADTQGLSDKSKEIVEYGDTMLLGMYEAMYDDVRYLVREKTKEKISISKDVFRLGKSAQECDYAILDNAAISRKHAEIVKQENEYFVVDLKSTNKTYVDNEVVTRHKKIVSGSKIRLANEEFTFYVE